MPAGLEVTMHPGSSRFDEDDQRWQEQVRSLHAILREEVGEVSRRGTLEPGAKGSVEAAVLALGSSGVLTAVVACFRAWLARDKTRTLTVTWDDGSGAKRSLHVAGDNIDQASFQALTEALGRYPGRE